MKVLGSHLEWPVFRDMWRREERLTLAERGKMDVLNLKINDDDDDDECYELL